MSGIRISQFPPTALVAAADQVPVLQDDGAGPQNRRATVAQIAQASAEYLLGASQLITEAEAAALIDARRTGLVFDTVAKAALSDALSGLPVGTIVSTCAYAAAGDGGGALYRRVASRPSHLGRFKDVSNNWWEICSSRLEAAMFGVVTGTATDFTANIRSALDLGGHVYLPPGRIVVDGLVIKNGDKLFGRGIRKTVLVGKPNSSNPIIETLNARALYGTDSSGGVRDFVLAGFSIDGNKYNGNTGIGLAIYGYEFKISDIEIVETGGPGIQSEWWGEAAWTDQASTPNGGLPRNCFMESRLDRIMVQYGDQEGIIWNGPHDSLWSDVTVGLCSNRSLGAYAGVHIKPNGAGLSGLGVHPWGDTHSYAFVVECNNVELLGGSADSGYIGGIWLRESIGFRWAGRIYQFVAQPTPTAWQATFKGIVLGDATRAAVGDYQIDARIDAAPAGAVAFVNAGRGTLNVTGQIPTSLRTGSVGYAGTLAGRCAGRLTIDGAESNHTIFNSGHNNSVSGNFGFVAGGFNAADGWWSSIPGGTSAWVRGAYGKLAYANGAFAVGGDAQWGVQPMRGKSTDETAVRLTAGGWEVGYGNTINLAANATYMVRIQVVARQTGGSSGTAGDSAGWDISVLVRRGEAGTTTIVGGSGSIAPTHSDAAAAAWRVTIAADTTVDGVSITGTGASGKTIQWVAAPMSIETIG